MKTDAKEIQNKDVKSMNRAQLDEFNDRVNAFAEKTKFFRNLRLLKILYYVFSYTFGIGAGLCFSKVLMNYIYTGDVNVKFLVLACIFVGICITGEILYRTARRCGKKYAALLDDTLAEIRNRYALLNMGETMDPFQN